MKLLQTRLAVLLLASLAGLHAADAPKPLAKPNFLVILTDDQGYGDVSAYHASLSDEVRACGITGVLFAREQVPNQSPAKPVQRLFQQGIPPTLPADPVAGTLRVVLEKSGLRVRALAYEQSPHGKTIAYFADCSALFGILKRHAVGFAAADKDCELLHPPRIGQFRDKSWVPEKHRAAD